MSRIGLILCGLYLVVIVVCLGIAVGADSKGRFVFLQLPLVLPLGALSLMGSLSWLPEMSWWAAYAVLGLPTLVLLYLAGVLIDNLRPHFTWKRLGTGLLGIALFGTVAWFLDKAFRLL